MAEGEEREGIKKVESWVEHAPTQSSEDSMDQVSNRVQLVIEAAERAAEAIRIDAQQQAQRYLAEAQRRADRLTAERVQLIAGLTDELIEHAGAVRNHSEQMVASLEHTIESVTRGGPVELEDGEGAGLPAGGPGDQAPGEDTEATANPPEVPDPPVAEEPELTSDADEATADGHSAEAEESAPGVSYYGGNGEPARDQPPLDPDPDPADEHQSTEPEPTQETASDASESAHPEPSATEIETERAAPEPTVDEENVSPLAEAPRAEPTAPGRPSQPEGDEQEAMLRATKLAIAGSDRKEIAQMLRTEFGIADPEPIIRQVLGS